MRIIELDAAEWKSIFDFYNALLAAIGAPEWHGKNPNALIDSMIWGGINAVDPPYTVRIYRTTTLPKDVLNHIEVVKQDLAESRKDYHDRCGGDVDVSIEMAT
jgi:RNAse (barnase) inhibitor barstar